jgi:23S rRNA (cytidine2498-2'-O)-methyltransferase
MSDLPCQRTTDRTYSGHAAALSTAYLAAPGFVTELLHELSASPALVQGDLVLVEAPPRPAAWAQNIWHEPRVMPIASIGDAARQLRAIQRNWALYAHGHHRRAALIQERLPKVSAKPLVFPSPLPNAPLGSWTLLDANTLLAAWRCSSAFPNGELRLVEDRTGPPSRAYLKLWEALTLFGEHPGPGDTCLDLGSAPGGWTWALAKLGAHVVSVDKAPLDPAVAAMPGVEHRRESAFAVKPEPVDWLFSDVICYPPRLLRLVESWIAAGAARRIVCTIKFQGATDHETAARFAAIPGARLQHLFHNKHELTWMWRRGDG